MERSVYEWAAMVPLASKINRIRQDQGLGAVVRRAVFSAYRRSARRFLPDAGYVLYGGLPVGRARKIGDQPLLSKLLPPDLQDNPIYEQELMNGLRGTVRPGDRVVVVGGGEGITASMAAMLAGETGSVLCFEGDRAGIAAVMRTAEANGVADRISCTYAVVGRNIGVFGTEVADRIVPPHELPPCDVLEMDCEGSEVEILREMTIQPRAVVVETHGFADASTSLVMDILKSRGYEAEDLGLAEPKNACVGRDEHVVVALRVSMSGQ